MAPDEQADAPWYREGLRFACQRCGRCCRGPTPGHVWVTPAEVERLSRRLGLPIDAFGRRWLRLVDGRLSLIEKANGDCAFYEDGRGCTVYEDRPRQCRTFPFWPATLASAEAWRATSWCRGIGEGRSYERAEIDALARGEGEAG